MNDDRLLVHIGVLGMKWGRRKNTGTVTKISGGYEVRSRGKNQSQEDFEADVAGNIFRNKKRLSKEEVGVAKEILAKAKSKAKDADDYAKAHPDDGDAQVAAYRAEKLRDKASGRTFIRLGKKKNQSDEDYDKEFDDEVEGTLREIANANKKQIDKKAVKSAERLAKDQAMVDRRKAFVEKDIEDFIDVARKSAERKGKKYDETEDRKWAESYYKDTLNMTVKDLRKERVANGVAAALYGLAAVSGVVYLATRSY